MKSPEYHDEGVVSSGQIEEANRRSLLDALSRCSLQRRIAQHRPSQHLRRMLYTVWDSSKVILEKRGEIEPEVDVAAKSRRRRNQ
jgi:hypothetical protein